MVAWSKSESAASCDRGGELLLETSAIDESRLVRVASVKTRQRNVTDPHPPAGAQFAGPPTPGDYNSLVCFPSLGKAGANSAKANASYARSASKPYPYGHVPRETSKDALQLGDECKPSMERFTNPYADLPYDNCIDWSWSRCKSSTPSDPVRTMRAARVTTSAAI